MAGIADQDVGAAVAVDVHLRHRAAEQPRRPEPGESRARKEMMTRTTALDIDTARGRDTVNTDDRVGTPVVIAIGQHLPRGRDRDNRVTRRARASGWRD